ncbi:MAG: hypothetical protein JRJ60_11210, partial [Deltaproteobacteria bacterium]|nr:hypothetical protein [Deltaproteobacteria bacterium]
DYYNHRIRKVDTQGIITTVAGNGIGGYSGDGGPATQARLNSPYGMAADASGNLYIADYGNNRIRKVGAPSIFSLSSMAAGDMPFADKNGLGYIMSGSGLHKTTFDLDTGLTLYSFDYDAENRLISITDRFGNETTIERGANGVPVSITSPDGVTTSLAIDANNHLTRITYPDGNYYSFEYTADGLMTAKVESEGNRFEHIFDANGRLTHAMDEEGGHWQFSRTVHANGDILTEVLTGEGNLTSYLDHAFSTGAFTSTITDATGGETFYERSWDGLYVAKNLPCGMALEFFYDLDPEYKFKYIKEKTESTPSGLEKVISKDKTYEDTDADDIPDLITDTVTINGNVFTLENNVLQSLKTITTPVGRTLTAHYDPANLLTTKLSIAGLHEIDAGYNSQGKMASIRMGTRKAALAYNAQGFLESITDPENHTTTFAHDQVGLITGINRPDGSAVGFAYDKNGNMTLLVNPIGIEHEFTYNKVNRNDGYIAPLSGSYAYAFDKEKRLIQTDFPSGADSDA